MGHGTIAIELDPEGAPGEFTTIAELNGEISWGDGPGTEINVSVFTMNSWDWGFALLLPPEKVDRWRDVRTAPRGQRPRVVRRILRRYLRRAWGFIKDVGLVTLAVVTHDTFWRLLVQFSANFQVLYAVGTEGLLTRIVGVAVGDLLAVWIREIGERSAWPKL